MKKLAFYFLLTAFLYSCSTIKSVPENQQLLVENIIVLDSTTKNTSKLNQYLVQRPNAKALGLPLSLYFYNWGNIKGSKDVGEWAKNHPKLYGTVKSIFSEKQSISFANTFIGLNNWFLESGQAPVVINNKKTKKSILNLKTYFQNNGYFKSKIWSKKDTLTHKKGKITYYINKGKPLIIDTITTEIKSAVLDSMYTVFKKNTYLKPEQYNNQHFVNEAERLTKLFRNNGVYHFNINSIGFYEVDTSKYNTNVALKIKNREVEKNGVYQTEPYKIHRVKKINVFTDYSYNKKDSIPKAIESYNGINYIAYNKLRYNPKFLSQSIFIKPNQIYSDSLRDLSRLHLRGLQNFKATSIRFNELNDKDLEANIFLTPIERYTFSAETELSRSNIRNYDVSANFSILNRNTFRGAEILKLSLSGSYFNSTKGAGWELGSDISLEVPRFMMPFGMHKMVPKTMFPKTRFFAGTSIQKNIGLDRQNFSVGIDYKWQYNNRKSIQLDFFNTQYIRNLNVSEYFNVYNSEYNKLTAVAEAIGYTGELSTYSQITKFMVETAFNEETATNYPTEYQSNLNILNRYRIITSDFLIPVIAYTFTYNNKEDYKDQSFSYFRARIANSGNVMGLLSNQTNSLNKKTVFKIPIAQYFKTDFEYKKFWELSTTSVVGTRIFAGAIIPYGDANIPFSKSYFAGGSNDIRAWKTYSLGPGRRASGLEYNIGSLKLLGNIEYRFDMVGSLKGALFIDGGNIWDITNERLVDEASKFKSIKSITDVAVGAGFGIRYDLKFLVARLDVGFKAREPYLTNKRWFQNFNFSNAVYNIGINYPF